MRWYRSRGRSRAAPGSARAPSQRTSARRTPRPFRRRPEASREGSSDFGRSVTARGWYGPVRRSEEIRSRVPLLPRGGGEASVRPAFRGRGLYSVLARGSLSLGLTSPRRRGSVVASATLPTRLETRTKESNMSASRRVVRNSQAE